MKPNTELAASLRAIHAAKVRHFSTSGGVQAFAIVATEERLADLLAAADALDAAAKPSAITHEQVREAALVEIALLDEMAADDPGMRFAIRSLCKRLGVEL